MIYKPLPESFIALNLEITHHPLLVQRFEKHIGREDEFILKFAEAAAYCDIAMDDWYNADDFEKIAHLILMRLQEMKAKPRIDLGPPENWSRFLNDPRKPKWMQ